MKETQRLCNGLAMLLACIGTLGLTARAEADRGGPEVRGGFTLPATPEQSHRHVPESREFEPALAELRLLSEQVEALKEKLAQTNGRPEVRERLLMAIRAKYGLARRLAALEVQRVENEVAERTAALRRLDAAEADGQSSYDLGQVAAAEGHVAAFRRYSAGSNGNRRCALIRCAVDALDQRISIMRATASVKHDNGEVRNQFRRDLKTWRIIAQRLRRTITKLAQREAAEVHAVISSYS